MKIITVDIAQGGKAICSDTNLGKAGEHNNTKLHIIMVDEELLGCDYFRCWFGNRYSTKLFADNGQIMFPIPQDTLVPPTVEFQLCGYKAVDGESYVIARSSVLNFSVDESACCSVLSDQAFEPFEILVRDCESAAKAAKSSETSAKNWASQASDFCDAAIDAVNRFDEFRETLESKADIVCGDEGQYMCFKEDGGIATAETPDCEPLKNSTKLITSGGVYKALGDIATALDNIMAIQDELTGDFKFTINKGERFASPRSTWQEWLASSYNTDGISWREDGTLYWWLTGDMMLCDEDGKVQYVTDDIVNGGAYTWKVVGEE